MSITTTTYERPGVQLFHSSDAFVRWVVREEFNPSPQGDWRAEKIKQFIDSHSAGDRWSIDEVCKALALPASVRQARRLFRTFVGMSFRKYAQMRRLAFAARQLEASEEPVKVIALEVGYRRTAEFTRSFKELFRLSPLEFRRIWSRRECAA
jgi:AraC-like DNA-binding protein